MTLTLTAPLSGVVVPLDEVPDAVFAQRMVGDGVSIDPTSANVLAPCDGLVAHIHRAGHALTIVAEGVEIMIHVGLDTVMLNGHGFTAVARSGDRVKRGDVLATFDVDYVATHARSILTQVIVTNMESVTSIHAVSGNVIAGEDVLLRLECASAQQVVEHHAPQVVESPPIMVDNENGLHARPAALLAAAARQFTSDVRIVKQDREANGRSVVSIMALEAVTGDIVRVVARGVDAAAAVEALTHIFTVDLNTPHATAVALAAHSTGADAAAYRDVAHATENSTLLRGVPASPGAAIGLIFHLRRDDTVVEERSSDPGHERRVLDAGIAAAHLQLEALQTRLAADADEDKAAIFAAHQELLEDPEVLDAAAVLIRDGASAAFAWRAAYQAQADRLFALRNPLLAARATDMRDVGRRVLHLLEGRDDAPQVIPAGSVVVAEDLTPSDIASLDRALVSGICTTIGSATSHVAILARALGIPAIAAIDPRALDIADGTRVVLDGDAGTLQLEPTAEQESALKRRQQSMQAQRANEQSEAQQQAATTDGHRMEVVANIGDEAEARRIAEVGGEGVGLLRTEFLFMDRRAAPDEDEQTRAYESIARILGPERILVIRTIDVGGDKPLPYVPGIAEANPFLGERGIRLSLNRPDLFRTQIRAVLRASPAGRIALMFPMVSTLAEWREARSYVEEERAALGVPPIQIGIMVETASAALLADRFAQDADFFSIGSNDLAQYTLAMDRGNPRLAKQLDALHPAVLHLIERTVAGAKAHGRWVGVCGAMAGDPQAVPVLIGLGVDELSVSVPAIPAIKARIRKLSLAECRITAKLALNSADGTEVRALVNERHV